MMKKLNLSLSLLLTLILFSCGSDDANETPDETNNNDLIVGKWQVTSINDLPENDCELLSTLDIKTDGTYEEQTYGGFPGSCSADDLDKGTWKLSDNILTLTLDELGNATTLTFTHTILELTETTLKYRFEHDNGDGTTLTEIWTYTR